MSETNPQTDNATDAAPSLPQESAPIAAKDDALTIPAVPAPTLAQDDLTTREASLVAHIKQWAHDTFGSKA